MMTPEGMAKPRKSIDMPVWVFRWRGREMSMLPMLFAILIVGTVFVMFVTMVRIRVVTAVKPSSRKASVIYLQDDAVGRALTLRARESGPFPSRFELSSWQGLAGLEAAVQDAVRFHPQPYVPPPVDLAAETWVQPLELAPKGERFFPKRTAAPLVLPDTAKLKLVPTLEALSGIATEVLPRDLPPYGASIDRAMSAASWRFLVRLNPAGGVAECVSLEKGGDKDASALEAWLKRIQFQPENTQASRWIGVGIGFINQPIDGTDAR